MSSRKLARPARHQSLRRKSGRFFVPGSIRLPVQQYIHTEEMGGAVLLAATVLALILANSSIGQTYFAVLETSISLSIGPVAITKDVQHWINEGLLVLFFFVVGLEIKREIVSGALSTVRRATLPALAATGGMIVPAGIYLLLTPREHWGGWAVPIASDTAFVLGVLALVGGRSRQSLRVLLLATMVVDDVLAVAVIAGFYSREIAIQYLLAAAGLVLVILFLQRLAGFNGWMFAVLGVALWLTFLQSGIHATMGGIVLGLLVPAEPHYRYENFHPSLNQLHSTFQSAFNRSDQESAEVVLGQIGDLARGTEPPLERIERAAHIWSAFIVLPIFALANAGVPLSPGAVSASLQHPVTQGIAVGLIFGKPIGIVLLVWVGLRLGVADLAREINWRQITGIGLLAGMGFTMSIFIAELAFADPILRIHSKTGILLASAVSGVLGFMFLKAPHRAAMQSEAHQHG
ncbi:MAG: Na+/H+ antiporter NhaA [Candidatus Korobacteraceae bacterium]